MKEVSRKHLTIDEYINDSPEEIRDLLGHIRKVIRNAAPGATEKISYGMPTFYLNGNLVHFAGFKNHIGFYPTPSGIETFKKELSDYKSSKGGVQFPITMPIPFELIDKIVRFRVKETQC